MRFLPEPPHAHDAIARLGVLIVNLGTPEAPTSSAVRRYLAEFLSDPRVVEIPSAIWKPILYGAILPTRPASSARKYAAIWTKDGSPLAVHSVRQRSLLMGMLGQRMKREGLPADFAPVELAMRYGEPSIASGLDRLRAAGTTRVLVLPLYPQYSASTTATVFDAVAAHLAKVRRAPALRFVDGFHDDAGYVKALAQNVNDYWMKHGRPERLVMSFHGVPRRALDLGDPYHCQCHATARLVARELGLAPDQWTIAFQSRFGRAEWLKPYTAEVLASLGTAKARRIDVVCPGFVSDCLETLEEIGIEGRDAFLKAGGGEFHAIPCLNEHPRWIAALADLAWRNLTGWLTPPPEPRERELTLARAKALGAKG
ncbi:protoporphyrin/coproporphyrin ferrochelatase [Burkholderiales bacterium]|nr:protoporphyrin/coproporphyrin ferrochelatase [Burkholderiales bacterium]